MAAKHLLPYYSANIHVLATSDCVQTAIHIIIIMYYKYNQLHHQRITSFYPNKQGSVQSFV